MKRWLHIVIACLLVLQPVSELWADDGGCDMAAMHSMQDGESSPPSCDCCDDPCEEPSCDPLCLTAYSGLIFIDPGLDMIGRHLPGELSWCSADQICAGHDSPAFRPPISA